MQLGDMHVAVLLLIAYIGIKTVDQVFIVGWRKMFGTKYVTEADCKTLRVSCSAMDTYLQLEKDIRELRGIIVRHMLLNNELTKEQKHDLEKLVI